MESKWLRTSLVAVLSLAYAAVAQAEDKKPDPAAPSRLKFTGRIQADALAGLSARVAGTVEKVFVDEGDRVKKGQLLIELSAPELKDDVDAAAARLAQAEAEVAQAEAAVQETTARVKTGDAAGDLAAAEVARARAGVKVARAGVEVAQAQLRRAQTRLGFTRLTAPFDGVVSRRTVDVGDTVGPATQGVSAPLVTVMRDDVVRAVFEVNEVSAPRVAVGAAAVVQAPSLGDAVFTGKVTRKGGAFNPDAGSLRAEVGLPNSDGKLRPGMFVFINVTEEKAAK